MRRQDLTAIAMILVLGAAAGSVSIPVSAVASDRSQVIEGEILLPNPDPRNYKQCIPPDLDDRIPDEAERPVESVMAGMFGHFFEVDPATRGEAFVLDSTGADDANLDILFWAPAVTGYSTLRMGGERGVVPPTAEKGYICLSEGMRAPFRYEAGPNVQAPDLAYETSLADHSANLSLLAHEVSPDSIRRLVFQDNYAISSSRRGIGIYRLLNRAPFVKFVSFFYCPGGSTSSDISIWGDYVFQSVPDEYPYLSGSTNHDFDYNDHESETCNNTDDSTRKGGLRVIDISDREHPRQVKFFKFACGSMNHTLVPHKGRLYIYAPTPCDEEFPALLPLDIRPLNFEIKVLRFYPRHPKHSGVVATPPVDDATQTGHPGAQIGCHDITVFPSRDLAACPQFFGEVAKTSLLDISDPVNPRPIAHLSVPAESSWMSYAAFTWDGRYLILSDSARGDYATGWLNECSEGGEEEPAAVWIFDVGDPDSAFLVSKFTLPREVINPHRPCVPWEISVVPMRNPEERVAIVGWLNGGMTVIDLADPSQPQELAHWVPAQVTSVMGSYHYNGRIYSVEYWTGSGIRVFELDGFGPKTTKSYAVRMNPQTQVIEFRN